MHLWAWGPLSWRVRRIDELDSKLENNVGTELLTKAVPTLRLDIEVLHIYGSVYMKTFGNLLPLLPLANYW